MVSSSDQWWVDYEGKSFAPFDNADEATTGAIRCTEVCTDMKRQSQAWARDTTGWMVQVWAGRLQPSE